jgi:hypothetical protein
VASRLRLMSDTQFLRHVSRTLARLDGLAADA